MSRADTLNQKTRKNIKSLFRKSEILAKLYPVDIVFDYNVEGILNKTLELRC